jgi:hypothetical protein
MKEYEMGRGCRTHVEKRNIYIGFWLETQKEKDH